MNELPAGWERKSLSDVVEIILGQSPPGSSYNADGDGVPFFQGKAEFGPLYPTVRKWTTEPKKLARKDEVLVSVRAPVGPTNLAPLDCSVGRGLAALRAPDGMPAKYLLYAMRTSGGALASQATGTTFAAVTGKQLRRHEIVVAPPDEQQRIVEAIEEQFSRLEAGVESLQRAKRNLARLRASVLSTAVSGELLGLSPDPSSAGGLFRLPTGWAWRALAEVAEVSGGIQKQPKRKPKSNAHPYLRVANVQRGELDLDEIREMELFEDELERFRLEAGDLLVVEGNGSQSQIGRSAVWGGQIADCVHQNHIIRVRPGSDLDPHFLNLYWNSPPAVSRITSVAASTSGLYTLSTSKLKAVPIPLPQLETQKSIVSEVDRQFSILDALTETVVSARLHSARLRQAILVDAFAGRLVASSRQVA